MTIFKLFIELVWLLRIVANIFSYIYLWYVKEYRWDRMLVHLRTKQGRYIFFTSFRLPPKTIKTICIFGFTCLTLVLFIFYLPGSWWFIFVLIDLFTFPVVCLWVGVLQIPTHLYHQFRIAQAKKLLESHTPFTVIGISGSYGKTSTKEYLATLLMGTFATLKTEASKNSPIGIAELVLTQLKPNHQVLVVEMGAYTTGEIIQMCTLVRPQIAIITAINEQHLDLFGSLENTMKAKYELVQGLTGKKIAIFNADNPYTLKMSEWAKHDGCTVWLYTRHKKARPLWVDTIAYISDIKTQSEYVSFQLEFGKEKVSITAPVLGAHQAENITASILGAYAVGLPLTILITRAAKLTSYNKTMQKIAGINDSIFIDDTSNNNPDAALAALEYIAKLSGKKYLVFQPMLELANQAESAHEKVARQAVQICEEIYLTNGSYYNSFVKGAKQTKDTVRVFAFSAQKTADILRKKIKEGDVILFKGKEAIHTLKNLQKWR